MDQFLLGKNTFDYFEGGEEKGRKVKPCLTK
jgi:hypothetical protein